MIDKIDKKNRASEIDSISKRGRPVKSEIRENITQILSNKGATYGYELYKLHNEQYFSCTKETIYYHLKKGVKLGIFRVAKITSEKGEFSWGDTAEKKFYEIVPTEKI